MNDGLILLDWWRMVLAYYSLDVNRDGEVLADGHAWDEYDRLSDFMSERQERFWINNELFPMVERLTDEAIKRMRERAQKQIDRINATQRIAEGAVIAAMLENADD